ncbi:MAG: porin [Planctomycetota bacterium]
MSKFLSLALLLVAGMGLFAAPAMAQADSADDLGSISRSGGEGTADTTLGKKGLVFTTDGFSLRVTTRVQFRLTYQNEVGHGANGQNGRDFINFRIRRAKTAFSGHIFQKEFQYKLTLTWAGGGDDIVEEAWFRWAFMQYLNISAGQAKLKWNWEEITSSGSQQFVDRSYVNEVFNQDFAKGITIDGKVGEDVSWLKYWVGIYNGRLKQNDDFRNADAARIGDTFADGVVDGDMMLNLRLETHPLGDIKASLNDGRGEDEFDQVLFAVGLAVNYFIAGFNNANIRPDTVATATGSGRNRTSSDTWAITIDGHFRWHGLSADVAFFWRHTEFHNRGANRYSPTNPTHNGIANNTDMGFTIDVSYFIIAKELNVGVRFGRLEADEHWQLGGTTRNAALRPDATEIGISVNYYLHGDNLKLTFDVLYVSEQLAFGLNTDGAGGVEGLDGVYTSPPQRSVGSAIAENADYADTWIVRLQLQWIF